MKIYKLSITHGSKMLSPGSTYFISYEYYKDRKLANKAKKKYSKNDKIWSTTIEAIKVITK